LVPIPTPEPTSTLIVNGVKTTGTLAWKLWVAFDNQRERGKLLRAALALAVCSERRSAADVETLAAELETALRATSVPTHGKQKFPKRVKEKVNKSFGRRAYREIPEMKIFGPTFGSHLSTWLRESLDVGNFAKQLAAIDCHQESTLDSLVERFPDAFEEELFDESKATVFREQLTYQMLLTDYVCKEMARRGRRRRARKGTERAAASVAASGGVAYTAANVLGASDPRAAVIGLGAAALGALIGGIAWEREGARTTKEDSARKPVLAWVARLLTQVSGKRSVPEPRALEAQLYSVVRDTVQGQPPLSPRLFAEAADEAAEIGKALSGADEDVLACELQELEQEFRNAASDIRLGRRALAHLFAVIAACDLGPRAPA
jgi:hypothetical protein